MATEHKNITDPNIHEPKGVASAASGEIYIADGVGSGSWGPQAANPNNVIAISDATDFPAPAAGVITLADNTSYRIIGNVDIGTDRLVLGNNTKLYGTNRFTDGLTYTGTGIMITATSGHLLEEMNFTCSSGQFMSLTGVGAETCVYTNCFIVSCDTVGTIASWRTVVFRSFSVVSATNATNGRLLFSGTCEAFNMDNSFWGSFTAGTMIDLGTATFDRVQIPGGNRFITSPGVTALSGAASSANLTTNGRGLVESNIFNGTGTAISTITPFDLKWTFQGNSGIEDSHQDAAFSATGNTTATVISTASTPVIVDLGATAVQYKTHRFSVSTGGLITYNGLTEMDFTAIFNIYADVASGTNKVLNFYIAKNGTVLTESISTRSFDAGDPGSLISQAIVTLETGDTLALWVENTTDTTNTTVQTCTCTVR